MTGVIWAVIAAAGIPSALFAWFLSRLTKKLDKRDQAREEAQKAKDEAQLKNDVMLIELVMASITLGEATAEAVQRIPDAHCNGDMHAALDFAKEAKQKYRQFEHEQTAKSLSQKGA